MGNSTHAEGVNAVAFGYNNTAGGQNSLAFGYQNQAYANRSVAFGSGTQTGSLAYDENGQPIITYDYDGTKRYDVISGQDSVAFGLNTKAFGDRSTAMGSGTFASGELSIASGNMTRALGQASDASGSYTAAYGQNAKSFGEYTHAIAKNSIAFGHYTAAGKRLQTDEERALGIFTMVDPYTGEQTKVTKVNSKQYAWMLTDENGNVVTDNDPEHTVDIEDRNYVIYHAKRSKDTSLFAIRVPIRDSEGNPTGEYKIREVYQKPNDDTWYVYSEEEQAQREQAAGGKPTLLVNYDGIFVTDPKADAQNAVAFGNDTEASAANSLAFGDATIASNKLATAFGNHTVASGDSATSFGDTTLAAGRNATTFGESTVGTMQNATAFGQESAALAKNATAFGVRTKALGQASTTWGDESIAPGKYATAFGEDSEAFAQDSAAWGSKTVAGVNKEDAKYTEYKEKLASLRQKENQLKLLKKNGVTADILDADGNVETQGSVSLEAEIREDEAALNTLYTELKNLGKNATAWGTGTNAYGSAATAWGASTVASGQNATAWGNKSIAQGKNSTAFGDQTHADGVAAAAWGNKTFAEGQNSTAFGDASKAFGVSSTAFGKSSKAWGDNSLAALGGTTGKGSETDTGYTVETNATGAIAIGTGAVAEKSNNIALGQKAKATGTDAIAIGMANTDGKGSTAKGANSIAIGTAVTVNGNNSIAIGTGHTITGNNSGAFGDPDDINGNNSYIVGNNSSISVNDAFVLGNSASVTAVGGVAIGTGSAASRGVETTLGYDVSEKAAHVAANTDVNGVWAPTAAAVAVGSIDATAPEKNITRRITGVAAGAEDTDAVNVAQLKSFAAEAAGDGVHYYSVPEQNNTHEANYNNDGATGRYAMAAGVGTTALGDRSTAVGGASKIIGTSSVAVGTGVNVSGAYTQIWNSSIGSYEYTYENAQKSTAVGEMSEIRGNYNTALGAESKAYGYASRLNSYDDYNYTDVEYNTAVGYQSKAINGNKSTTLGAMSNSEGNNNVAIGYNSNTSYHMHGTGHHYNNSTAIGANSKAGGASVAIGGGEEYGADELGAQAFYHGTAVGVSSNAGHGFGNVAIGYKSSAYGTADSGTGSEWGSPDGNTGATAVGAYAQANGIGHTAFGYKAEAKRINSIAIGRESSSDGANAIAIGYGSNTHANGSIAQGAYATSWGSMAIAQGAFASANTTDSIAIGDHATIQYHNNDGDETKRVATSAIAIGNYSVADGKDATAVGRQSQAMRRNATAYGNNSHANAWNSIAIGNKSIAGLTSEIEQQVTEVDDNGNTTTRIETLDALAGQSAVAVGNRARATKEYTTAVGASAAAEGWHAVAIGDSNRATGRFSTAIGAGASEYKVEENDNDNTEADRVYTVMYANQAAGDFSTAVGYGNKTTGEQSSALGKDNAVSGTSSLGIGVSNKIGSVASEDSGLLSSVQTNTVSGYAVGSYNTITGSVGSNAGAFGASNIVSGYNSYVIGNNSKIEDSTITDAFILGNNASVTVTGGVAIGSSSVADRDKGDGPGYDVLANGSYNGPDKDSPTWTSTAAAVSVGGGTTEDGKTVTRQIINVAAGSADTDAVNVAQLRVASTAFATHYYSVSPDNAVGAVVADDNYQNTGATGAGAIAAGHYTSAQGAASSAFGNKSVAVGDNSVAAGYRSFAASESSSAYGVESIAYGKGSIAIGHETVSGALVSLDVDGKGTDAIYTSAVIKVKQANADGKEEEYIFRNLKEKDINGKNIVVAYNTATGEYYDAEPDGNSYKAVVNSPRGKLSEDKLNMGGISMGSYAHAEGDRSLAMGRASGAYGESSSAIGIYANAVGDGALAIGHGSSTGVQAKVVSGDADAFWTTEVKTDATGNPISNGAVGGIAIGSYAHTEGTRALAVGRVASAYGTNSMAVGLRSSAYGEGSIAFGHGVVAGNVLSPDATQVPDLHDDPTIPYDLDGGDKINVDPNNVIGAVAIGSYAEATARGTLSVGRYSKAGSAYSTALGIRAVVSGDAKNSVAIGREVTVLGENSVAVGVGHTVAGKNSGAFGDPTVISSDNSYAVGNNNSIDTAADNTFILGNNARATAEGTVILGNHAVDNQHEFGQNSVSLGTDAQAKIADSVALGSNAVTNEIGGYAKPSTNDVVIGDGDHPLIYSSSRFAGTGSNVIGTVSVGDQGKERTITNLAAGRITKDSTDAINGSQLYAALENFDAFAGEGQGDQVATDNRAVGLRVENDQQKIISPYIHIDDVKDATADGNETGAHTSTYAAATGTNAIAIGIRSRAQNTDSIAIGDNAEAYGVNTVAIGKGAQAGDRDDPDKSVGAVAIGGKSESTGEYSVAMQNGHATGDYAVAFGENTIASGAHAFAFGKDSHAAGANSLAAIGGAVSEDAAGSAAIGAGAAVQVSGTVALGSKSVAGQKSGQEEGVSGYDILLDGQSSKTDYIWRSTENAIAVGDAGNHITRKIIGVAAGVDDTDAVNVAQLKKVAEAIVEGGSGGSWNLAVENSEPGKIPSGKTVRLNVEQNEGTHLLELKDDDKGENGERTVSWVVADAPTFGGNVTAQSFTAGDIVINDKEGNINMGGKKITNVAPGENDTDAVNVSQLNNSGWNLTVNDDKVEKKSKVANNGTVRMQVQQPADTDLLTLTDTVNDKGERVVSWVVTDTPVISSLTTKGTFTSSGPAVFEGPVTMKENLNMSGKQIKNLAWATDDNDAVPYGQLKDYVQNTGNNLSFLNNKIERGLAHVGSRAAALAALHPLDYDPDKPTSIMAGFGHYKGDSSVALGVAHHFNDDTLLTVGSTVGHETMVNVGLSLRLGRNTNMTEKRWKVQRHTAVDYDARLKVMERRYKDLQLDKDAEVGGLKVGMEFLRHDNIELRKDNDNLRRRLNAIEHDLAALRGRRR